MHVNDCIATDDDNPKQLPVEEEFISNACLGLSILFYFFPALTSILAAIIENWNYFSAS